MLEFKGCLDLRWKRCLLYFVVALAATSVALEKDYYKVLGISRDANAQQIKRAYKKQAVKWHPDKHQGNKKDMATEKFQLIAQAYETLSDPEKRKIYDLGGEDALKGGAAPDPSHPGPEIDPEILRHYFARMFTSSDSPFSGMPGYTHRDGGGKKGKRPKQGGPLFASTAVGEIAFTDHEVQIQKLVKGGPTVVLFYASGGMSCPDACHRIKTPFIEMAVANKEEMKVVAVQCLRRKGYCAELAVHFPAVVLFTAGNGEHESSPKIISKGVVPSSATLMRRLDAELSLAEAASVQAGSGVLHELTSKQFKKQPDMCDGQFCLLFFLAAGQSERSSAWNAARKAAMLLRGEPVVVFSISGEEHRSWYLTSFSNASPRLRSKAPRAVLYRPKRERFDFYEGDVSDGAAVAQFVSEAISRGQMLPYRLQK